MSYKTVCHSHIDPRSHIATEVCRAEIGSVGDGKSLEDTPRQTLDDTSHEEHLKTSGEEWNEDSADHDNHAANHGLLVADPLSNVTVDDQTENASNLYFVS